VIYYRSGFNVALFLPFFNIVQLPTIIEIYMKTFTFTLLTFLLQYRPTSGIFTVVVAGIIKKEKRKKKRKGGREEKEEERGGEGGEDWVI